jgi:PmbA protein
MPDSTKHEDRLDILHDLIGRALEAGADAADALYVEGDTIAHAQRLGQLEQLERAEGQDLGLRVFVGKRQASVSSTELKTDHFDLLAERAVSMARAVPEDPHCGIAPAEAIATDPPKLEIHDPAEPSAEVLIERARVAEDAARAVPGVTNSDGAEASWDATRIWMAASNGFAGHYARSSHGLAVSVIAGEGSGMENAYEWHNTVFGADLMDSETLGRAAGERAVARLGARRIGTAKVPVIYDRRVAGGLVSHLLGAISGTAIARGTSFLKDSLGQPVFADGVSVIDDPHRARGLRSKPFDGEGLPTRRWSLIDGGVLTTWILDLHAARKLGLDSTGHAARGTSGPPSPAATNVHLTAGTIAAADMLAGVERGLLVTELMGMGINMVTGDYSRGASGFWIENGAIAHPVSEVTVAGNLKDMFLNMTPADDLEFRYGVNAPTVRVDGMTVAGTAD